MGSGDITDISIVTIVGIDIVRICGFYVIVERYRRQLLLPSTVSSPDRSTDLVNKYLQSLLQQAGSNCLDILHCIINLHDN